MLGTITVNSDLGTVVNLSRLPFSTQKVNFAHKQVMKNQRVVVVTQHEGTQLINSLSFILSATTIIAINEKIKRAR